MGFVEEPKRSRKEREEETGVDKERGKSKSGKKQKERRKKEDGRNSKPPEEDLAKGAENRVDIMHEANRTVSIRVCMPGEAEVPPFVCTFPPGVSLHAADLPPRVTAYRHRDSRKKDDFVFVVETPGVDYIGRSVSVQPQFWHGNQYALGVMDGENNTMRLTPLTGNRVIRMEARVHGVDYAENELSLENQEIGEVENRERQKRLVEAFGGAKSQRMVRKQMKEDHVNSAFQSDALANIVHDASHANGMLTAEEISQRLNLDIVRNIPPHDLNATAPENAYPLDQIITVEELDAVSTSSFFKAAKSPNDPLTISFKRRKGEFIANRLPLICKENDEEGNEKRAIILSYLSYLLDFYNSPHVLNPSVISSKLENSSEDKSIQHSSLNKEDDLLIVAKSLRMPIPVAIRLLKSFMYREISKEEGKEVLYKRSLKLHRLLTSYITVLSLHLDNFQSDPKDLMAALKIDTKHMFLVYKELGCKINKVRKIKKEEATSSSDSVKYTVTLPVPLKLPTVDLYKTGKRKR